MHVLLLLASTVHLPPYYFDFASLLLRPFVSRSSIRECILIYLLDTQVIQISRHPLLLLLTRGLLLLHWLGTLLLFNRSQTWQARLLLVDRFLLGHLTRLLLLRVVRLRAAQKLLPVDGTLLALRELALVLDAVVLLLACVGSMGSVPGEDGLLFEVKRVVILREIAAVAFVNYARRHQLLLGVGTLLEFGMGIQVTQLFESGRLLHYRSLLAVATLRLRMFAMY